MNEEHDSTDPRRDQTKADPGASPGQRLDQFISGAKRLGSVTGQKAKEIADAAAPTLKNASETASRTFASRSANSPLLAKGLNFLNSGGKARKGLLIYGGIIGGLLVLSLIAMPFIWMATQGSGPNRSNLGKVQTGMTEDQVDKLLGMPSNSDKKPDGSLVKTWKSQYAANGDIRVTFVSGKATAKAMDEPPSPAESPSPVVGGGTGSDEKPAAGGGAGSEEKRAMLEMGDKFGPGDSVLAQSAIDQHQRGLPWSVSDDMMNQASPEMKRAYRKWRAEASK